jgi:pimeloyl-ACP methyl ester carboxylesterase
MLAGLLLLVTSDTAVVRNIPVAPAETLRTTSFGQGPPIVVITGLIGSAYAYRKIIPSLSAEGLSVIVIEPLGVGASSRPGKSDYSLTAQAQRIAAALDSLGGTGCAPVLAHSMGVSMALRLALQRPDLVCGIVAEAGGATESVATGQVRSAARYAWLIKLFGGRGRIRSQIRKGLVESSGDTTWITRELIDHYTEGSAGDLGAVLRAIKGMARAVEPEALIPRLSLIQVPVQVLVGGAPGKSGVTPWMTGQLATRLPQVRVDTVPGSGSHIHEEQPQAVINAVLELVRRLRARSSPLWPPSELPES